MITNQTRRYSLIQISQHRSQTNQFNQTLNRIYSADIPIKSRVEQDKLKIGPSYVSPSIHQINIFNSKRNNPLKSVYVGTTKPPQALFEKKNPLKKPFLNLQKAQDQSIILKKSRVSSIRDYFNRLAIEKRSVANQKKSLKVSNKSREPQEDKNEMLIVQRAERIKKSNIIIHNTHFYYFSKRKRAQTENQTVQVPNFTSQRQTVTLSRLMQMREQISKENNKLFKKAEKDTIIEVDPVAEIIQEDNEVHKGQVEINIKDINLQSSKQNKKKIKTEQQDISPWKRRRTNQFDPY